MLIKNELKGLLGTIMMTAALVGCNGSNLPYQNTSLSAEERATDLVARLTLDEKISLMQNESPAIPRLGIKEYNWWSEALHGVGRSGLATVFPQCIGMAASFDDSLLYDVYTAVSDEARAKYADYVQSGKTAIYQGLTFWTPNVNIFRDPRWGRGQETYGEDPYLTATMGVNVVRGLQGPEDARYNKVHACAKHYAVHSGPEWNRHTFNAENISPRDLWETYLPAFKSLVQDAGVKEVMCAYNRYEGNPCCGSDRLLQQILRDEWGYQGIVVSDCGAINDLYTPGHHFTEPDSVHASSKAVISGTDLECGSSYQSLKNAVAQGLVDEATIDKSVIRLMKARFELGEMDTDVEWNKIPYSVVNSKEHQQLALKMAQESMVLLLNKDNILPLSKTAKIAIVGPNANDSVMQWGNYNGFPGETSTLESAMRNIVPEDHLIIERGCGLTSATWLESTFGQCSIDGKKGFKASYWNKMRPEGEPEVFDHVSEPFHFTTKGATVFAPGVSISEFCAKYETVYKAERTEKISFSFDADGYVVVMVNGQTVSGGSSPKSIHTASHEVEAGKEYQLTFLYLPLGGDAKLNFDLGREKPLDLSESVKRVTDADVVIFSGGISPSLEGEEMSVNEPGFRGGDRENIDLPDIQKAMLRKLKEAGKKIIFVNHSGSAIALKEEASLCDAIIQAWYPGQAGGEALASVIFGDYNPSGRLPVTFYSSSDQLPDFCDYNMKGHTYRYMTQKPLFPFGYGLSYTTFSFGDATLSATEMHNGEKVVLSIPVMNTGSRDGEEVIQVYIRRPDDKEGPNLTLRAFKRVSVKKGETANVEITLDNRSLEWFDTASNSMRAIDGTYEILYGSSSELSDLKSAQLTYKY